MRAENRKNRCATTTLRSGETPEINILGHAFKIAKSVTWFGENEGMEISRIIRLFFRRCGKEKFAENFGEFMMAPAVW